jgi:hypothetical protein
MAGKPRARAKESPEHAALSKALTSLIPSLDVEGLAFLVEQARVHLHNMEVASLEADIASVRELASRSSAKANGTSASKKGGASRSKGPVGPVGPVGLTGTAKANWRVERSSSGSSYHLISGGKWKMFSEGELTALVRISQGPDGDRERGARLYRWLADERMDALGDLEIEDEADPKLAELSAFLRKAFKVKER